MGETKKPSYQPGFFVRWLWGTYNWAYQEFIISCAFFTDSRCSGILSRASQEPRVVKYFHQSRPSTSFAIHHSIYHIGDFTGGTLHFWPWKPCPIIQNLLFGIFSFSVFRRRSSDAKSSARVSPILRRYESPPSFRYGYA